MMLVAPVVTQAAPKEKMPEGAPVAAEVTNTEDGGVLPIPSMQAEAPGAERHLEGRQIEAEEQSQDGIPVEEEQAEEGVENELEKDEHNAAVAAAGGVPSTSPPEPPEKSLLDIMRIIGKRALGGGIPGALAGGLQVATLMWLRTVGNYQYRYGSSFTETVATLYKQGGIGRFYEGMGFALVQGPLSRFGSTAANDGCRALLKNFESTRDLPIFFSTFVASIAAGAWRLVLMPIDTSKTVLQVEGNEGYRSLMRRISRGEFSAFYQGALATAAAAAFGHFPWFYVYGVLDEALRAPVGVLGKLCRNAFIGFMASAVSDALTNVIRVIKTTKQATASLSSISYMQTVQIILAADGWKGLFGRGLSTRILTNGLQSILFTVVWRALSESTYFKTMVEPNYEDDDDGTGTNSERAAQESTFLEQPLHKQQQHHQKPRGPLRGAAGQAQAAEKKKTHQD